MNIKSFLFLPVYLSIHTIATTLYASHYDGHIFTLSLSRSGNSDANNSLTLANTLQACGSMPSWLTLDSDSRTLYCVDESGTSASGNGSLSSFAISSNGSLSTSNGTDKKVATMGGGVASVIYHAGGKKFLAIAHYEGSALSTFQLPLSDSQSEEEQQAYQVFTFTLAEPGSNPSRQDASHPHQPILDPTGKYVLVFDLGADLIRIFAIDAQDGKLTECEPFKVTSGNGPRHGAFSLLSSSSIVSARYSSQKTEVDRSYFDGENNATRLYVVNELANTLSVYAVDYPSNDKNSSTGLSLSTLDEITPYSTTPAPNNSYVAEIRIPDDHIYVSIRNDQGFVPDDSMATLQILPPPADNDDSSSNDNNDNKAGVAFKNLSSSYGAYPRTFAISPDGSMVAIGDQVSSNVAVVARDVATGQLGELLGSVQVGSLGQVGQSNGLSSVVWGDD